MIRLRSPERPQAVRLSITARAIRRVRLYVALTIRAQGVNKRPFFLHVA